MRVFAMGVLARQTWTLQKKNIHILVIRHWLSTFLRTFLLPIAFIGFIAFARNLLIPPSTYGVGSPTPVKDLARTLANHASQRLVFVTNNLGGDVQELVDELAGSLRAAGGNVVILEDPLVALRNECKQSLRGASHCFAAVVFRGSPGTTGGAWNYTLRGDTSYATSGINVKGHDDDVQTYLLPVLFAVDKAIANKNRAGSSDGVVVEQYMYTDETQKEHQDRIRSNYMKTVIKSLSIAVFLGFIGIVYHQTGFAANERERGTSTLLEAMGVMKAARIISYQTSFSAIYFPSWVVMGLTVGNGLFAKTNIWLILVWFVLTGWACASWSVFMSSFFKRAQLSGVTATVITMGFGILAQVQPKLNNASVTTLSLLFPSANFVYTSIGFGRFEADGKAGSLFELASQKTKLPCITMFIFLAVQIIGYPLLAALVEKYLHGTGSGNHKLTTDPNNSVELRGFTKRYAPSILGKILSGGKKETVTAINALDLNVREGQVLVLLGANGSGKTTTLEAISGLAKVSEGEILINAAGNGHIGICPQRNVFWDELTVEEHIFYWNRLKCAGDSTETLQTLLAGCDLTPKKSALSCTLSGGQKRKLQLAIMFTGGSTICAIDEVSSGLDPLSRRKIWDIVLAARGERTIILTTHFLDEADLLADDIAVLSKGTLKCQGSAVELKARLGGGYRVSVPKNDAPELDGIPTKKMYDQTVYNVPDSAAAGQVVDHLESLGIEKYRVSGPTIEDVFLKVAEEAAELQSDEAAGEGEKNAEGMNLYTGKRLSIMQQTWVIFRKRLTILRRNYFATLVGVAIPLVVLVLSMKFLRRYNGAPCNSESTVTQSYEFKLVPQFPGADIVLGSRSQFAGLNLTELFSTGGYSSWYAPKINYVDTISQFKDYIKANHSRIEPGGLFVNGGDDRRATFVSKANAGILVPMALQVLVDNMVLGQTVAVGFAKFDTPWRSEDPNTLLFVVYVGLGFALFPAFFALYPTLERIRQVRALHYSSGVRELPLWLAHLLFDFLLVVVVSVIASVIMVKSVKDIYFNFEYFPAVLLLYGIASTLLSYNASLIAKGQLSAFAITVGGQALMFLLYIIAVLLVLTYTPAGEIDSQLLTVNFALSAISPIANLARALFLLLNMFSMSCDGEQYASNPGAVTLFGGPIMYLILQSCFLFGVLVWWDSGRFRLRMWSRSGKATEGHGSLEEQELGTLGGEKQFINQEAKRVGTSDDGLKVMGITKSFGSVLAVNNVSFGIPRGEVFALLGPNGAGKTTTINMIRGDMAPDSGQIFVENISIQEHRSAARAHLGVCPQFDAIDRMSVVEHLRFYAKARGVEDVEHNVTQVIKAVGLGAYKLRMAEDLSGGNKRKLSLGIALIGNPTVLLLDEPSSGMDAASKRIMWKTLAHVTRGRSLVLTTHSMEEADALANRAGILAGNMLAVGTGEELRRRWGDGYHVHLVLKSAPASTADEMAHMKSWVLENFRGVVLEDRSFHGQMRFSVPMYRGENNGEAESEAGSEEDTIGSVDTVAATKKVTGVNRVFKILEASKKELGLEHYSISQSTLDQVFLTIVGDANVAEEGYGKTDKKSWWRRS